MLHIKKVKTFKGLQYAVVDEFTYVTNDSEGKPVRKTEYFPVEYKTGEGFTARVVPAVFPVTSDGLVKAKEIQKLFKKKQR